MAKPNYSFEKRQREIAKKKKKEEKLSRKTAPQDDPAPGDAPAPASEPSPVNGDQAN